MPRKPRFTWSVESGRYRDTRTGRYISELRIRSGIDRAIARSSREMSAMSEDLRAGRISLSEWSRLMREEIKSQQIAAATIARGGAAQMSPTDYGRVGGAVANQYRYLNRFEKQIAKGLVLDGRFKARVDLYSEAARTTYETTKRERVEHSGGEEERNILGDAQHCEECEELTAAGWQPIGSMPPPGRRQCGNRCKCRLAFR